MLSIIGEMLFGTGAVMAIGGVVFGVLSHWSIVLSSASSPKIISYFIYKTWWILLMIGVFIGGIGYELQEISNGTFEFEWAMPFLLLAFPAFMFGGYFVIRDTLKEIKKMTKDK